MKQQSRRNFIKVIAASSLCLASGPSAIISKKDENRAPSSEPAPNESLDKLAMSRICFGGNQKVQEMYLKLGNTPRSRFEQFVEQQLNPESINDDACEQRVAALKLSKLGQDQKTLWHEHVVIGRNIKEANDKSRYGQLHEPTAEVEKNAWMRAVYSERQLQEQLSYFWHNHFNVYPLASLISPTFVHYDQEVIRKHLFGNFREFVEAVAKSPAMLIYLDGTINRKGNPNENYARELFELHTLGAENYAGTSDPKDVAGFSQGRSIAFVDHDIREAARCFTGWTTDSDHKPNCSGKFYYSSIAHDQEQKVVLGNVFSENQPDMKDALDVLNLLTNHPGTARFIARKLCQHFISDQPQDSLVEKIATIFHDSREEKDQIRRTMRAILLSEEFAKSWGQKLKRPFEHAVALLRSTGAEFNPTYRFLESQACEGERLFRWRSPDGAPDDKEKWLSSNSLIERFRITNFIFSGMHEEVKISSLESKNGRLNLDDLLAKFEKVALPVSLSEQTRNRIIEFAGSNPDEAKVRMAVALLYMTPEAQWR